MFFIPIENILILIFWSNVWSFSKTQELTYSVFTDFDYPKIISKYNECHLRKCWPIHIKMFLLWCALNISFMYLCYFEFVSNDYISLWKTSGSRSNIRAIYRNVFGSNDGKPTEKYNIELFINRFLIFFMFIGIKLPVPGFLLSSSRCELQLKFLLFIFLVLQVVLLFSQSHVLCRIHPSVIVTF